MPIDAIDIPSSAIMSESADEQAKPINERILDAWKRKNYAEARVLLASLSKAIKKVLARDAAHPYLRANQRRDLIDRYFEIRQLINQSMASSKTYGAPTPSEKRPVFRRLSRDTPLYLDEIAGKHAPTHLSVTEWNLSPTGDQTLDDMTLEGTAPVAIYVLSGDGIVRTEIGEKEVEGRRLVTSSKVKELHLQNTGGRAMQVLTFNLEHVDEVLARVQTQTRPKVFVTSRHQGRQILQETFTHLGSISEADERMLLNRKMGIGPPYRASFSEIAIRRGGQWNLRGLKTGKEFLYVIEGDGVLQVQNDDHALTKGDIVYIPPEAHRVTRNTGSGTLRLLVLTVPQWQLDDEMLYDELP